MPTTERVTPPPPVARGLPVVGVLPEFARDRLGFLERVARDAGDVVELQFKPVFTSYFVNDPALIEQVLVKNAANFTKDIFLQKLRVWLGMSLLTAEGDYWKRQRRLLQPSFHRERVASYARVMVERSERATRAWRDGEVLDVHEALMKLTAEIVGETLFGSDVGNVGEEVSRSLEAVMRFYANPVLQVFPVLQRIPTSINRDYLAGMRRIDAIVRDIVKARRATRRAGEGGDLLSMLLAVQDEDGSRMTDVQVRDEAVTIFLAGHETTALALSWSLHLLSENPDVERKLHAEIDAVIGAREPALEDLPKLKYTDAVVHEALRLYPPAWSLGRESIAPFDLGKYRFPAGSWLWFAPWVTHRDPRWFDDPLTFKPERWEDGLAKRLPKFAYYPFGGGPRVCIGNQFAIMEAVLVLATIARRFSLRTVDRARVEPFPSVTLRFKQGLRMRASRRGEVRP
jgi:cytochrome P450